MPEISDLRAMKDFRLISRNPEGVRPVSVSSSPEKWLWSLYPARRAIFSQGVAGTHRQYACSIRN